MTSLDWFERLMGFSEDDGYDATQRRLIVEGDEHASAVNGKRYGIGELTLPTLAELRSRVNPARGQRSSVRMLVGDVRELHSDPEFEGALFQVASQFNLLEMASQHVPPEDGVAIYIYDHTQGPACAIAAGAATIYRNYCVPVNGKIGQTSHNQLNALDEMGSALSANLGRPVSSLWTMQNGYAMCTRDGLDAIASLMAEGADDLRDELRGKLRIGLHRNVEVTDVHEGPRRPASQAFCSALPVTSDTSIPRHAWEAFARLILEAAYEATMLAAVEQSSAGASSTVLLTRVGGSAFGNADEWIDDAIGRALGIVEHAGLDVRLVSYGHVERSMQSIADDWGKEA